MKILFVGLGSIGQRHLRNLKQIMGNEAEIFAYRVKKKGFVLNDKLEITAPSGLEEKYNIHVVDSLEQAWKIGMDCVFICNPNGLHMDILLQAAEYGCHIFVEKPLSHNYEHVDELEKLVSKNQLILFVGYQHRFHPCIKKVREILHDQTIGKILMVNSETGESVKIWHKYEDYRTMYACHKELGGGVVICQIHELDYLTYLFGMPQSVYAVGGKLSDLEIDVEDVASILMKYDIDGRTIPICIQEDYIQNPPIRNCRIVGTKGKIEINLLTSEISVYDDEGQTIFEKKYDFERNDMFMEEMQAFLNAVNKKSENIISLQEGIKSLKVALAAKESLETGQIVNMK